MTPLFICFRFVWFFFLIDYIRTIVQEKCTHKITYCYCVNITQYYGVERSIVVGEDTARHRWCGVVLLLSVTVKMHWIGSVEILIIFLLTAFRFNVFKRSKGTNIFKKKTQVLNGFTIAVKIFDIFCFLKKKFHIRFTGDKTRANVTIARKRRWKVRF